MTLEELICERLTEQVEGLAEYGGAPAVFNGKDATDTNDEWNKVSHYPCLVFQLRGNASPDRQTTGELLIDVICSTQEENVPNDIAQSAKDAMENVFFTTTERRTYSTTWLKYSPFMEADVITGITLTFDVYEFTNMEAGDPDPIVAINEYAAAWDREVVVVGRDMLPSIFVPTRETPAMYFRKQSSVTAEQSFTAVWINAVLVFHLYAPTLKDRIEWIDQFCQSLIIDGEVTLLDGSPMFVQRIRGDANRASTQGQILIDVRYGLLKRPKYAHTMRKDYWNE